MTPYDSLQLTTAAATALAGLAAVFSATTAFLSYRLTRKLARELKEDEIMVAGVPVQPQLSNLSHQRAVLCVSVFNKSHRKAYVKSVDAFDSVGTRLSVDWSDHIDDFGNPENPSHLVGVTHSATLFIRTKDGIPISPAVRLEIAHSFPNSPLVTEYNPLEIPMAKRNG